MGGCGDGDRLSLGQTTPSSPVVAESPGHFKGKKAASGRFVDTDSSGTLNAGDTDITHYTWDHRNRLTVVTHYANYTTYDAETPDEVVEYTYDFGNRWVRRIKNPGANEEKTIFVYDDNQIVAGFEDTGSADLTATDLAHRYLWGPAVDQVLADETVDDGGSEDVLWPLSDHLHTVRDLATYDSGTDTTTIANHIIYDAYGALTSQTAPAVDHLFGYTGRPLDEETGLQNNLNRWYDAGVGRWLSEDPIGFEGGDGNLYRYVGNRPTRFVDPNGLWEVKRLEKSRADAVPEEGDTIAKLATYVGLNGSEWEKWLTIPDDLAKGIRLTDGRTVSPADLDEEMKLCPGQRFEVPNSIVAAYAGDLGPFVSAFSLPHFLVEPGKLGRAVTWWPRYVDELKREGFAVVEHYHPPAKLLLAQIGRSSNRKELHGLFEMGHGHKDGFGSTIWKVPWIGRPYRVEKPGYFVTYTDVRNKLQYKLGVVLLFSCYSDTLGDKGLGGRHLVSANGVFWGDPDGYLPIVDDPWSITGLFEGDKQGTRDVTIDHDDTPHWGDPSGM